MRSCPHCNHPISGPALRATLFAGQIAHECPECHGNFRLTYAAKRRVAFLNVILMVGLFILFGIYAWGIPYILYYTLAYIVIAGLALFMLPGQAEFESTSSPDH